MVTINLEAVTIGSQLCLQSLGLLATPSNMCFCKISKVVDSQDIVLINLNFKLKK